MDSTTNAEQREWATWRRDDRAYRGWLLSEVAADMHILFTYDTREAAYRVSDMLNSGSRFVTYVKPDGDNWHVMTEVQP